MVSVTRACGSASRDERNRGRTRCCPAPRAAGLSSAYTNAIARLPHPSRRFGADDEPTRSRGARGWLDHGFADASAGITSAHACSERALEPQRARPRPLLWSIRGCHLRVESFVFEPFVSLETNDRRRARTRAGFEICEQIAPGETNRSPARGPSLEAWDRALSRHKRSREFRTTRGRP